MKKVLIAFPVLTGQVDVRFLDALLNTTRAGLEKGIDFCPYFVTDDALVQRVRNDIIHAAYNSKMDDCIFLDSDIVWTPDDVFKLLLNPFPVVGASYRKKSDDEVIYVGISSNKIERKYNDTLLITDSLGFGFIKLNKEALVPLYENSPLYFDSKSGEMKRAVFQVEFSDLGIISEDVYCIRKLKELGFDTYIDTTIDIQHIGRKMYGGSLKEYLDE
jgi:hypothetical protein